MRTPMQAMTDIIFPPYWSWQALKARLWRLFLYSEAHWPSVTLPVYQPEVEGLRPS